MKKLILALFSTYLLCMAPYAMANIIIGGPAFLKLNEGSGYVNAATTFQAEVMTAENGEIIFTITIPGMQPMIIRFAASDFEIDDINGIVHFDGLHFINENNWGGLLLMFDKTKNTGYIYFVFQGLFGNYMIALGSFSLVQN